MHAASAQASKWVALSPAYRLAREPPTAQFSIAWRQAQRETAATGPLPSAAHLHPLRGVHAAGLVHQEAGAQCAAVGHEQAPSWLLLQRLRSVITDHSGSLHTSDPECCVQSSYCGSDAWRQPFHLLCQDLRTAVHC